MTALSSATVLSVGSVALGGALAFYARRHPRLLARTRVFAFLAAAAVVLLHLLPEAVPPLGAQVVVFAFAGFAFPALLEGLVHGVGPGFLRGRGLTAARVAAEVGFVALFVHSLLEGLTLRAALATRGSHADLELALLAHHVPLTAAVVLPLLEQIGFAAALSRLVAIAAAGGCGALAGGYVPGLGASQNSVALARATAVMAGALLHVVWDELRRDRAHARALAEGRLAAKRPSADSG
jgi:hypothetical protein